MFDNFCWYTSDHAIIWYILHNDSSSCHSNIIPYMYRPYYRHVSTKRYIITYCWSSLLSVPKCCTVNTHKVISYRISSQHCGIGMSKPKTFAYLHCFTNREISVSWPVPTNEHSQCSTNSMVEYRAVIPVIMQEVNQYHPRRQTRDADLIFQDS